ncbi:DUF7501 family protein [Halopiger aswanensis]|uniref:Uncharacterized protein n=1 Tax=Halopiger aswanensis TaxID=148449 RepID=A0A3R7KM99_9EURY|nr:hypothetical protein [Halopiger aswanensis]RKD97174.1 hypothetical protein ATJ93_0155 [Halopiger aswanensis]
MSTNGTREWVDPIVCPFCGDELPSPGAGFVDHIDENEACEHRFDRWRTNIAGDIGGEWTG